MKKTLRVAVLSATFALFAAPVFAGPGGNDPPPPPTNNGSQAVTTATVVTAILTAMGA
ncbi:MAG: hypothetical protein WA891_17435 [Acidobacteriaceae bacterium]|jgi:hypothetical protein